MSISKIICEVLKVLFGAVAGLVVGWLLSPLITWESPFTPEKASYFEMSTVGKSCSFGNVNEIFGFFDARNAYEFPNGADELTICADAGIFAKKDALGQKLVDKFPGCFWMNSGIKKQFYVRHDQPYVCRTQHRIVDGMPERTLDGGGILICLGNQAKNAKPQTNFSITKNARKCNKEEMLVFGFN